MEKIDENSIIEISEIAYIAGRVTFIKDYDMKEMFSKVYMPIRVKHIELLQTKNNLIKSDYMYISKFAEDILKTSLILKIDLEYAMRYVFSAANLGFDFRCLREELIEELITHGVEEVAELLKQILNIYILKTEYNQFNFDRMAIELEKVLKSFDKIDNRHYIEIIDMVSNIVCKNSN